MPNFTKRRMLNICEFFISHQGEGRLIGELMYFIRLGGCNLNCIWCDTRYAKYEFKEYRLEEVVAKIKDEWRRGRWICITGGEPLMQENSKRLIEILDRDYKILLETNGSFPIPSFKNVLVSMDVKCPSSGEENSTLLSNIELLKERDQLKFVIGTKEDYDYALNIIKKYKPRSLVVFQPQGGLRTRPEDFEWLFKRSKEDSLNVRVILQQHKLVFGDERGV
ncbi:MAG: 7-carboxy-7-deazaguanine synthase [Candidatus Methanolliviera sp. GoM_asphalt]|nr:MAG: 7-carboxy-7-deazaguanine synthase [Candidatus Methanolliviera sp. GoM_asphalt]